MFSKALKSPQYSSGMSLGSWGGRGGLGRCPGGDPGVPGGDSLRFSQVGFPGIPYGSLGFPRMPLDFRWFPGVPWDPSGFLEGSSGPPRRTQMPPPKGSHNTFLESLLASGQVSKWTPNRLQISPDRPKFQPKLIPNRPPIGSKSVPNLPPKRV